MQPNNPMPKQNVRSYKNAHSRAAVHMRMWIKVHLEIKFQQPCQGNSFVN